MRKGFRVAVATDGDEAWDMFKSGPASFDLVVTDQTMPGLSGVELASRMLEVRGDLPVILCTGYADVVAEARSEHISAFMPKPIDSRAIVSNVVRLLRAD